MTQDGIREAIAAELALLKPEVRNSPQKLEALLAPDFTEIGASGRHWTRTEIIAALLAEGDEPPSPVTHANMAGRVVAPGLVLLTYDTTSDLGRARRSSLWRQSANDWQVVHHQGTPLP